MDFGNQKKQRFNIKCYHFAKNQMQTPIPFEWCCLGFWFVSFGEDTSVLMHVHVKMAWWPFASWVTMVNLRQHRWNAIANRFVWWVFSSRWLKLCNSYLDFRMDQFFFLNFFATEITPKFKLRVFIINGVFWYINTLNWLIDFCIATICFFLSAKCKVLVHVNGSWVTWKHIITNELIANSQNMNMFVYYCC